MNFVMVGAGGLGSTYAAYLARAVHQVSLIALGERAEALARHGIGIMGEESFTARCNRDATGGVTTSRYRHRDRECRNSTGVKPIEGRLERPWTRSLYPRSGFGRTADRRLGILDSERI